MARKHANLASFEARAKHALAPQDDGSHSLIEGSLPWLPSTKTSRIDAHPDDVWSAVRDFGAVHTRLAPGFVIDSRLDGDARIVTFANGSVARELLVDCDEARRRLVYAIANERVSHYSASVQVIADGEARSRLIWIVDVLPNEIAPYVDGQMDLGAQAVQKAFTGARHDR